MKSYNRIMLGRSSCFAEECISGSYIGADFDIDEDLTGYLEDRHEFKKNYIPIYLANRPDKSKTAAGVACVFLYTICKDLKIGDIVLCPDGKGFYYVGTIIGDYYYVPNTNLQHRRKVKWFDNKIKRSDMSKELQNSTSSIGTCCNVTKFASEIETLISNSTTLSSVSSVTVPSKTIYLERDLHKVFCSYLRTENIIGKTIYHEKSSNKADSNQKWVHPDIVGVRFEEFKEESTSALQKVMETKKAVCLCSYEMKRTIEDDYQLKQCYFQALSNSSWANYGYLVAYEIDDSLQEEIARLNAAFGIGVILLQAKSSDVKILCQAKEKELDYNTIDKLCHLNPDFKSFIEGLTKVMNAPKNYADVTLSSFENSCDDIFKDDKELEDYCNKNCIPY